MDRRGRHDDNGEEEEKVDTNEEKKMRKDLLGLGFKEEGWIGFLWFSSICVTPITTISVTGRERDISRQVFIYLFICFSLFMHRFKYRY